MLKFYPQVSGHKLTKKSLTFMLLGISFREHESAVLQKFCHIQMLKKVFLLADKIVVIVNLSVGFVDGYFIAVVY